MSTPTSKQRRKLSGAEWGMRKLTDEQMDGVDAHVFIIERGRPTERALARDPGPLENKMKIWRCSYGRYGVMGFARGVPQSRMVIVRDREGLRRALRLIAATIEGWIGQRKNIEWSGDVDEEATEEVDAYVRTLPPPITN